jgi:hypothetical protein
MLGLKTISKEVVKSDRFCDLDFDEQALYFHLLLNADENGIIDNVYAIARYIGIDGEDFKAIHTLVEEGFFYATGNEDEFLLAVNKADWEKHTGNDIGGFFDGGEKNVCKNDN